MPRPTYLVARRLVCRLAPIWLASLIACESGNGTESAGGATPTESPAEGTSRSPAPADTSEAGADQPAEAAPQDWTDSGWRRAYSLMDNRHLLHTYDTGLFIDMGHPSALKYVQGRWRGPWRPGTMEDGRTVGYTDGIGATFRFPLTVLDGDLELVAQVKAVRDDQRVDVFLNGDDALPTVNAVPSGAFGSIRVTLPQSRLRLGENTIRFHFSRSVDTPEHGRTAAGFDWVRIQPAGHNPAEAHQSGAFGVLNAPGGRPALRTPAYGALVAYFMVPDGGRLRVRLAAADNAARPAAVRLLTDGQEPQLLWQGTTAADAIPIEVDLGGFAGSVVRLELAGTGPVDGGALLWIDPVVVVAEQPARTLDPAAAPTRGLVWLIDTLRSDFLTIYNPDAPPETPHLTAYAENCVVFRRHSVQGNSSLPASASIHTSSYPVVHGINGPDVRIDRALTVLGEAIESPAWDTGLFSSNGYVSESRGFGRGYDAYRNLIHEPGRPDTEYLWPIAREWINSRAADAHWFAFLNTIDPHVPYDPPADILARYHPEPYTGRINPRATGELLDSLGESGLPEGDMRYLLALHYGEITYNDQWFGIMLEELGTAGVLEDTVIVVTSDHGEQFGEHGRIGHGTSVMEEVVSVPLLICHPRSLGGGRSVETEVESIDIYPTLLDLFDLNVPTSAQGTSLLPLMLDPTPVANRPAFSYHQEFLRGMRIGRWKYQLLSGDNDHLYDLSEGVVEGEDRRDQYPLAYRYARDVMAFHLAFDTTWRKAEWGWPNNHSASLAEHLDAAVW